MSTTANNHIAHSRLEHMPISLFATVMGMAGLTIATQKAESLWHWDNTISMTLLAISVLIYTLLFVAYSIKTIKYPTATLQEFKHPIRMSFFPAVSIGLLLLSIPVVGMNADIAFWMWSIGSVVQMLFTLIILSHWIHHDQLQIQHSTPAWFIPVVGNILIPITGVELGYQEISWFFFSVGIIMWLPLQAILLNRFFFHPMMPVKLLPTLFILIAPPAVGFISWLKLHNGVIDDEARLLYYFALFLTMLMTTQLRHFAKVEFALPWWAYSFPVAAITIATMIMQEKIGGEFFAILSVILYSVLWILLVALVVKTSIAIMRGKVCVPE
jgi:tellurite resistance protein